MTGYEPRAGLAGGLGRRSDLDFFFTIMATTGADAWRRTAQNACGTDCLTLAERC